MFRCSLFFEMVSCYAVFLILVSAHLISANDDVDYPKPKRAYAGVSGLTPFPRTGRSDPELMNWDNTLNLYDEYEEYPHIMEVKRQGLIPFPRVGRSGAGAYLSKAGMIKRGGPGGSGMWFGPRLGRIQKRSVDMRGVSKPESQSDLYTPRLGRESGENLDAYDFYFAAPAIRKTFLKHLG